DFKLGEEVFVLKPGRMIGQETIKNLSEFEKMHLVQLGRNQYEIIEPPGCYVNHSCEPNIEEKNRIGYALTDIKTGEEIIIDYDEIAYLEKPFECHCGAEHCRGFVRGKKIYD
ncbi:MAG: SET domain-containing protein-lysine N-methyltransferase, partial [Candidatus Falkowbacteria bacterium]|nr:SET domain-containing protein-lysine N-methyltransferase [Candidatus Falkowbacteria bacterium]